MRDFPTIDCEQVAPNVPKYDAQKKRCFYALRSRGSKQDEGGDDNDGIFLNFF